MEVIEPKLNDPEFKRIDGEDHLGIRYVAINISDALQPGITSITPRARYWSFFAWVLYDFIQMDFSEDTGFEKTLVNFKRYLKQQECFFVYANIAVYENDRVGSASTINGLQGIDMLMTVWQSSRNEVPLLTHYLQASFGGYAAYRNVMKTTGVTVAENSDNNIQIDRMTMLGRELAEAFTEEISETEYYKHYRKKADQVPKSVLLDYGRKASLTIPEAARDLPVLQRIFVPHDPKDNRHNRADSLKYYKYVLDNHKDRKADTLFWREMFFDVCSIRGEHSEAVPDEFKDVAQGWEIFQTRQYFTYALEGIWSYTLLQMKERPITRADLIVKVLSNSKIGYDPEQTTARDLLGQVPIKIKERRTLLKNIGQPSEDTIMSSLLLMLDVYLRLKDRADFDFFHTTLLRLGERRNISLQTWFDLVDQYLERPVADLFAYVIERFCINQHKLVALEKIMAEPHNQTFHFNEDDGLLHHLLDDRPTFNVLRTLQGISIARDIRIITEAES